MRRIGTGGDEQAGGLAFDRAVEAVFVAADQQAGLFGEQVGAPRGQVAELGDRGGVFSGGEIAPLGVAGGGAGELCAEDPVRIG